jgi:hypothetical protein
MWQEIVVGLLVAASAFFIGASGTVSGRPGPGYPTADAAVRGVSKVLIRRRIAQLLV